MGQPTLVVDFGTCTTAAAVVVGDAATLVRPPATDAGVWPAAAGDPARLLGAIRAEALRAWPDGIDRLALTVPASYPVPDHRRDLMIATGEAAGFGEVELVGEPEAALLDAVPQADVADGALVLLCDLGGTWTTALLQVSGPNVLRLGHETSEVGHDLDAKLAADPDQPSGAWIARLADAGLRWAVASCRSLLARAAAGKGVGTATGAIITDVSVVILVGGWARLPSAEEIIHSGLQRPVLSTAEPELGVVRGAARWVASAAHRRVAADPPRWRVESLAWHIPGGRGRLTAWQVSDGQPYAAGASLAQIRTIDDRVFELTAVDDGALLGQPAQVGDIVGPTLVAPAKRQASCLAGDAPEKRQELWAAGEWLLTPDRRLLVECAATGRHVKVWSIPDGSLVRQFRPDHGGVQPDRGRVFVDPRGRLSLVAWDVSGSFSVWDVNSGRLNVTFRDVAGPRIVLVNEGEWRLTAEGDGAAAGRYRRSVATMWDLSTGLRVERRTDQYGLRRLPGYSDRSAVDGFGEQAFSPDGRLRAVAVRDEDGSAALALQEATNDHEVFRAEHAHSLRVRMAFTADGRFLLANWEADQRSQVEVWEL